MKTLANFLVALLLGVAGLAAASGDADLHLVPAPLDPLDHASLQRGARTFVNYCLNCHSAKYMRYNRLADIGLTEQQIRDNLMFATDKIGDTMTIAMPADKSKGWFGVAPPDLSVESRIRGSTWLYNYLLAFYRDDKAPSGWNNLVFPNVAMPHALWQLQGTNKLVETKYEDFEKATAAAIGAKGLVLLEPVGAKEFAVLTLAPETPGSITRHEYEMVVADLVNFLDYVGEPARTHRMHVGWFVLLFLGILFALAYATKREYWKDVH